mmetsp:Transcript_16193/g.45139  ORF Transcript_16193/g.45139 Transcript_16193/m.45139 type:complete len:233 (-) Transcript_16193:170-868(-)
MGLAGFTQLVFIEILGIVAICALEPDDANRISEGRYLRYEHQTAQEVPKAASKDKTYTSRSLRNAHGGISPDDGFYNEYHTYDEYVDRMLQLADRFPNYVRAYPLPRTTAEGRDIYVMHLNNVRQEGEQDSQSQEEMRQQGKQKILLTGMQHAREWLSGMAPMYIAEEMAGRLEEESDSIVDQFEVVVVPVVNPDGFEVYVCHLNCLFWCQTFSEDSMGLAFCWRSCTLSWI